MPTATQPKLNAKQARDLADADAAVAAAQAKLDQAKAERDTLRDRLRTRITPHEAFTVGGVTIKVTPYEFQVFSLKDYRAAGKRVTAAMSPFVKDAHGEKWTVKRAK